MSACEHYQAAPSSAVDARGPLWWRLRAEPILNRSGVADERDRAGVHERVLEPGSAPADGGGSSRNTGCGDLPCRSGCHSGWGLLMAVPVLLTGCRRPELRLLGSRPFWLIHLASVVRCPIAGYVWALY